MEKSEQTLCDGVDAVSHKARRGWKLPEGMRPVLETLRLAWPLMLAQIATALYDVCDGWFLARAGTTAVVASLPARMVAGTLTAFFLCTIGYVATFVAQYHGGGRMRETVSSFAQGLWMALFASPVFLWLIPASWFVIGLADHVESVRTAERAYLLIAAPGGVLALLNVVLGAFFVGQGRTRYISLCAAVGCLVNLLADSVLVLGFRRIPALGISGAALATVMGNAVQSALLAVAVCRAPLIRRFATWDVLRPRLGDLARILRFGAPTGLTALGASFAFMVFTLVLTRLDTLSANAANALFRANSVFYMVLCATADSTSVLVGRAQGAGDALRARRAYAGGLKTVSLALAISFLMLFAFYKPILDAFCGADGVDDIVRYHELGWRLICIMFFRELAEGVMCLTVGALRGAGDTRFVMVTQLSCDLLFWMPLVLCLGAWYPSVKALWLTMPLNMGLVALVLCRRWRSGRWQLQGVT